MYCLEFLRRNLIRRRDVYVCDRPGLNNELHDSVRVDFFDSEYDSNFL